ncbi:hypothetical protein [Rhodococcus opacus]|uniref:hypothetical protein n=1 Tax=Rhodococcus opacus TaxID=37919 RepID=UPI002473C3B9|nr:hypothetical protein [Rhodococcus opacus]MDH6287972.1 hypothetical protein [Rhodococcus opacus]
MRAAVDDDSVLAALGVSGALPPVPDDVWARALEVALDPTTAPVDADLVPDMDDVPVVSEDDDIILLDDTDLDTDDGDGDIPNPDLDTDADDDPDLDLPAGHDFDLGDDSLDPSTLGADDPADLGIDLGGHHDIDPL